MNEAIVSVSTIPSSDLLAEKTILKEWQEGDVYARLLQRAGTEHFIIQEMPAAIHNFKLSTFKCKIHQDVFLKVQMMQGKGVVYTPSWNNYALAIERQVFNEAHKGSLDSLKLRRRCRRRFQHQLAFRQQQLHALGVFGDWKSTSKNLDSRYESKLINTFTRLRNLGYLNKDRKLGHWCRECNIALSEDEIKIRRSKVFSGFVKFPISQGLEEMGENISIGVWIEDLWRLAGSVALGLKKDSRYLITELAGEFIIFAEEDLSNYLPKVCRKDVTFIEELDVNELMDYTCTHPFLGTDLSIVFVPDLPESEDLYTYGKSPYPTDLVHLAPGHHPADYRIAQVLDLPILSVVDDSGRLTDDADLFCGLDVSEVGQFIALELEKRGYFICGGVEEIPYPHCWTCDSPVLYRPVQQWIFSLDNNQLRHRLLNSNECWGDYSETNAEWIKKIIQDLPDICVSCHRGWSIPLPIFQCERCDNYLSDRRVLKAVRDITSRRGTDVWFKLSVGDLLPSNISCSHCESKEFQKESALLEGRFAMLLDIINRSDVKKTNIEHVNVAFFSKDRFPQWYANLVLTSIALHNKLPFKHLELVPIPNESLETQSTEVVEDLIDKYPADVLRILGVHPNFDSQSMNALAHDCEQEYHKVRTLIFTMLNDLEDFQPSRCKLPLEMLLPLDALALSATNQILQTVDDAYQQYHFYRVWRILKDFCESDLQQFYLPILKGRLQTSAQDEECDGNRYQREKRSGQTALWEILHVLVQRFAPITPFFAEQIHARFRQREDTSADKFASIFLGEWMEQIEVPDITDVDARWKKLQANLGGN
ncbi:class I tRNA ligase family protein [Candidatus Poribacteria bacterium]|nr:class I tRNA ligase family protein [Candidatus Poribacteria bacterium]